MGDDRVAVAVAGEGPVRATRGELLGEYRRGDLCAVLAVAAVAVEHAEEELRGVVPEVGLHEEAVLIDVGRFLWVAPLLAHHGQLDVMEGESHGGV